MKKTKLGMSLATVAALAAPAAGAGIVADAGAAGAISCASGGSALGSWVESRELPLMLFGTKYGSTAHAIAWQDSGCDGHLDTHSDGVGYEITNPALVFCYTTAGNLGSQNGGTNFGDGWKYTRVFYFSLLGGPCSAWNTHTVSGYTNGAHNPPSAHGLFCWTDYAANSCKEVD